MAKEKLLQALKRQAFTEIIQLRHDAAERRHQLRKEYASRLRMARNEMIQAHRQAFQHDVSIERLQRKQQQRLVLTQHRWALSERLKPLADEILKTIWEQHRQALLAKLLTELPHIEWSDIRVSGRDLEVAQGLENKLPFRVDPELEGGLIAECGQRSLMVDCSLPTLLERLWPNLLPRLLERISNEAIA